MICDYGAPKFKGMQTALNKHLDKAAHDTSIDSEKRNLASVLNEIISEKNIIRFVKLDKLNLTYNSWSNETSAINENLLASQNITLLKILHGNDPDTFRLETVIEALYLVLYADTYEASLIITEIHDKKFFEDIVSKLNYYIEHLSSEIVKRLNYLWFEIPKNVFTIHLNQHLDEKVLQTVDDLQKNEVFIQNTINISNKLNKDIEVIKRALEEQKTEYNFVGLSKGFASLKSSKVAELESEKFVYNWLIGVIIFLIIAKSAWSAYYLNLNDFNSPTFIIITISTILFLFILLYFFRISLVNVKSIKSQILQIDLRLTLCQFIHNYDSDTKDLREGMKESFSKFESVIFSPLVATEDQMPSTFDGLEQLTGMIGLFNKKSD